MKLATRIAGAEWLLVALLVGVSALSIKLIGTSGQASSRLMRSHARSLRTLAAMREALWAHEIASERIRAKQGRPQEMYEARGRLSRMLGDAKATVTSKRQRLALEAIRHDRRPDDGADHFDGQEAQQHGHGGIHHCLGARELDLV